MADVSFRFAPDILRRLGEELNPSIDQGLLELVKNAYDANAQNCVVAIGRSGRTGASIKITDDGDGMTESDIRDGWLVIGKSTKDSAKRTRLGRIPAGNKGLGRLAALRLGRHARLITRPRGGSRYFEVTIEWDQYDSVALVEDVPIPIASNQRTENESGTDIEIGPLRSRITRMDIKRLARSLILLADPFGDEIGGFRPVLRAPEFKDLERMVADRYFNDADYHLIATLRNGTATARVVDWRGEELFKAGHKELASARDGAAYGGPDATFELWAFILNRQAFATRTVSLGEVRDWIESFGGVHLYMNGLRVGPYGDPGNDWLDMNLRRVQSPEERPSTNNAIGRISVEDTSARLVQKTDRGGFIENEPFDELRTFAQDALEWMARRRLQAAEARRRRERAKTPPASVKSRQALVDAIDQTPVSVRAGLQEALGRYDRARQRETDALRREVQLYRTLSTAGITAATFAHESAGSPLKVIGQAINAIEFRGRRELGANYTSNFERPVNIIKSAVESLSVLTAATLRLIDSDKRRVGRVDLNKVVDSVLKTFQPFLTESEVRLERRQGAGRPYLHGTEAAIESILTNFLNNSVSSFQEDVERERVIVVETDVIDDVWRLTVADSGLGLRNIAPRTIWLPGETTRSNGTGLGLTIVRDAAADLGGSATVKSPGRLGGADFVVELPILGAS